MKSLDKLMEALERLFNEDDWQIKRGVLRACGDMLDEDNCRPSPARAKALKELLRKVFGDNHD
jgi:hypothetical protein